MKYEDVFNEKLTMCDKTIEDIFNINDNISQVRINYNYLYNNLQILDWNINQEFISRLYQKNI